MTAKTPKVFIGIDLETTGLVQGKHGICQIGAWATGEDENDFRGYYVTDADPDYLTNSFSDKKVERDEQAFSVNGFTNDRITKAPTLGIVLREFNKWLGKFKQSYEIVIVGQNTPFDVAWLKSNFHANGLDTGVFRRVVDNASLGFAAYGEIMGQSKLAAKLGIKNGNEHDALGDAYTAIRVFHGLIAKLPAAVLRSLDGNPEAPIRHTPASGSSVTYRGTVTAQYKTPEERAHAAVCKGANCLGHVPFV